MREFHLLLWKDLYWYNFVVQSCCAGRWVFNQVFCWGSLIMTNPPCGPSLVHGHLKILQRFLITCSEPVVCLHEQAPAPVCLRKYSHTSLFPSYFDSTEETSPQCNCSTHHPSLFWGFKTEDMPRITVLAVPTMQSDGGPRRQQ